jgi:hypothetical protein
VFGNSIPTSTSGGTTVLAGVVGRSASPRAQRILLSTEFLQNATKAASQAQVTVSANLTDGTGATYRTAYLHFQLLNCGDNFPAVPSEPSLLVRDSFDIHPTLTSGLVTGTIIGNDQILCGNVASTWYHVTPMVYAFAGTLTFIAIIWSTSGAQ